jgi:putative redox protein
MTAQRLAVLYICSRGLSTDGCFMNAKLIWKENLQFTAEADGHVVLMDAKPPLGQGKAQTPKQLVLAALCGCTAMDVASLIHKQHQDMKRFEVTAEAPIREGAFPAVFSSVDLAFRIEGVVDPALAVEAARLSQTRFCSISAMLSRAVPIRYEVFVNGVSAGSGEAQFAPDL